MSGPRVTIEQIESRVVRQEFFTAADGVRGATLPGLRTNVAPERLHQVTFCVLLLDNGHVATGVNYGPIDPVAFDRDRARSMARAKALDSLWEVFGFAAREPQSDPKRIHPGDSQRVMAAKLLDAGASGINPDGTIEGVVPAPAPSPAALRTIVNPSSPGTRAE